LIAVADLVTMAWLNLAAQIVALIVGLVGVILLGLEFYSNTGRENQKKSS